MSMLYTPTFPSSQRRGGCAANRKPRSHLVPRRRGGQTGESLDGRRTDHPVRSSQRWLRNIFITVAATPPLRGGECVCLLLCFLSCLLTACSVGPKYKTPPTPITTAFKEPPPADWKTHTFP